MTSYTFWNLIDDVLSNSDTPLSEREIWDKAVELGLDKKLGSMGKTPWKTISASLYLHIRDNEDSKYVKVGKRKYLISKGIKK